jgi:micrococcal nuclease
VRVIGIVSLCLFSIASLASAQTIAATDAAKHVGEHVTVCGSVASEHTATSSRGTPTFINLDRPYPNQVFTVLVWGSDRERVGNLPTSGRLCAVGNITEYRGTPEIVLHDSHSWYVPK